MTITEKGKNPFYPGQPVPREFFTGRKAEIERILRSVRQVELGKPQAVFLTGEYGIGKSSLAGITKYLAEKHHHLLGIHVSLGSAKTVDDLASRTVETVLTGEIYEPTITEKFRDILGKYIEKVELFGVTVKLKQLKADAPNLSMGFLPFLKGLTRLVEEHGIKGIFLIFDEINGIVDNPQFAFFLKELVDTNSYALNRNPVPLLLMLCGVERIRQILSRHHPSVSGIFDIVDIKTMSINEMNRFYSTTFNSVGMSVTTEAMSLMCHYSSGFPRMMHIIGDAIYYTDKDNLVDEVDTIKGILLAADEVGKKFVDEQIYKALRSSDYLSILNKLGQQDFDLSFQKSLIEATLTQSEKKKFSNFLQRLKRLKILTSGDEQGEYVFTNRLVRLYVRLNSVSK